MGRFDWIPEIVYGVGLSISTKIVDLEWRNGVILRYFSEFAYLPGVLRKSYVRYLIS